MMSNESFYVIGEEFDLPELQTTHSAFIDGNQSGKKEAELHMPESKLKVCHLSSEL